MHIVDDQMYYYKLVDDVDNIIVCNDSSTVVACNGSELCGCMVDDGVGDVVVRIVVVGSGVALISPLRIRRSYRL